MNYMYLIILYQIYILDAKKKYLDEKFALSAQNIMFTEKYCFLVGLI